MKLIKTMVNPLCWVNPLDRVKPKTIKLVFVASQLSMQH